MATGDPALALDEAGWLIADGRPRDAIPLLESIVRERPLDPEVRTRLAQAHLLAGDAATATRIARDAVALTMTDEWPRRLLAYACLASGEAGEAIVAARAALDIEPGNVDSLKALFEGQLQLKLLADAAVTARLMKEMAPDSAWPHADLARALLLEGDIQEAEAEARRALEGDPHNIAARNVLASALHAQGRSLDALSEFARAASENPANRYARRQLVAGIDRYVGVWSLFVVILAGWLALNGGPMVGLSGVWSLALAGAVAVVASVAVIAIQRRRLGRIPPEVWQEYKAERRRTRPRRWGWVVYNLAVLAVIGATVLVLFDLGSAMHADAFGWAGALLIFAAIPIWRFGGPWFWRRHIDQRLR